MAGKHLKAQPPPAKGNRGPVGGQPVGEPDAGNPHVRFDEGETWKRSMAELVKPRLTKGPTDRLDLNHRATSLLYQARSDAVHSCARTEMMCIGVHWCAFVCIGVQKNGVLPLRAPHQKEVVGSQ
jgi:hypothetical protein